MAGTLPGNYMGYIMDDRIFGYTFDQISAAQQGKRLGKIVDTSKPIDHSPTNADVALLAEHGAQGLKDRGFFGTIDRLQRAGLI